MKAILIFLGCSQIFELCHTFKGFITYFHVVILTCIVIMKHKYQFSFLITYFQTSLITSDYQNLCNFLYSIA